LNRWSNILRWSAFGTLAYVALSRAQTTRVRLPYWDLDPTLVSMPETGLMYSTGFIFDALVWLAAAMTIASELLARRRIHWASGLLVLVGALGAALHGLVLPPPGATPGGPLRGDFIGLALGSAWAAAVVGGWSMLHLARDPAIRKAAALALLGFVTTLIARGAYHVYIDHAHTVRQYKADPAAFLAAQGTEPGSTMAREFERRLMQPEAIGWFGLANVYGTLVGAAFVFFLGLSVAAWQRVREQAITSGPAGLISLVCLAAGFGVYLSGSKGAMGAIFAGLLAMGLFAWSGSRGVAQRLVRWVPLTLTFAALGAVALRGLIGERIGELSLLFRWHYLVGATRIFGSEPVFGVGPNGFKNAYGLHKVPLNPEWVESPHSIFFDWLSTLGLFGAAWCAVLVWLIWRVGHAATAPAEEASDADREVRRGRMLVLAGVPIVLATATSWYHDWATITPDEWPLRLIALAAWGAVLVIGGRVAELSPRALVVSLAGAAVVVAVHSQIELTPTQPGSCLWVMLVIGAAGALRHSDKPTATLHTGLSLLMGVHLCLLGMVLAMQGLSDATRSEVMLRDSSRLAETARQVRSLESQLQDPELRVQAVKQLRQMVGDVGLPDAVAADASPEQLSTIICGAVSSATASCLEGAEPMLDVLASRLRLELGSAQSLSPWPALLDDRNSTLDRAGNIAASAEVRWPNRAEAVALVAATDATIYAMRGDVNDGVLAMRRARRVLELDPYALTPALRAYQLSRQIGDDAAAREMAAIALRNNAYLRLDPLKQLTGREVAELEAFLASPVGAGDPSGTRTDDQ